jgi:hypothetical protein
VNASRGDGCKDWTSRSNLSCLLFPRRYTGVALNQLTDFVYTCTPSQLNSQGQCPVTSGEQIITSLGLNYLTTGQCAAVLVTYIVVARFVAYLGIRHIKW